MSNPKSIPWENCVTISQYSLISSNLLFLLLQFSWDFRFCFPLCKIPLFWYTPATFLHQISVCVCDTRCSVSCASLLKRSRNGFTSIKLNEKTKIVYLHSIRIGFDLIWLSHCWSVCVCVWQQQSLKLLIGYFHILLYAMHILLFVAKFSHFNFPDLKLCESNWSSGKLRKKQLRITAMLKITFRKNTIHHFGRTKWNAWIGPPYNLCAS